MKKLLFILFLFCSGLLAQDAQIRRFAGAPTGNCNSLMIAVNQANGDFYTCYPVLSIGTWIRVGSGSIFTGGTANQLYGMNAAGTAAEWKTLATGTTGTDFGIAHTANTVTFNLPDASATARGLITTGEQTLAGTKKFSYTSAITTYGSAAVANQGLALVNDSNATNAPFGVQFGSVSGAGKTFAGIFGLLLSSSNNTAGYIDFASRAGSADATFTLSGRMFNGGGWYFGATPTSPGVNNVWVQGAIRSARYETAVNCSDGTATPADCTAAPAGSVIISATATVVVVNTTAVTADSQIFIQEDSSLGTKLSVTCNTTLGRTYAVTARTAATSFTITTSAAPITNPSCLSFFVVN